MLGSLFRTVTLPTSPLQLPPSSSLTVSRRTLRSEVVPLPGATPSSRYWCAHPEVHPAGRRVQLVDRQHCAIRGRRKRAARGQRPGRGQGKRRVRGVVRVVPVHDQRVLVEQPRIGERVVQRDRPVLEDGPVQEQTCHVGSVVPDGDVADVAAPVAAVVVADRQPQDAQVRSSCRCRAPRRRPGTGAPPGSPPGRSPRSTGRPSARRHPWTTQTCCPRSASRSRAGQTSSPRGCSDRPSPRSACAGRAAPDR